MAYTAALQMLMENLKKLIHGNDIPLIINNNPSILSQRPQFQLLYQELASHHHHHQHLELKKVRNLNKRFKDVVEEAQDIIDLYLSAVTLNFRNSGLSPSSDVFKTSLNLQDVMRSIKSIKVEFMTINIDDMKMDSSPGIDSLKTQSAGDAAGTTTSLDLLNAMRSIESMLVDFMNMDSSPRIIRLKTQSAAAGTSCTGNPLGKQNKPLMEEIVVGLDHDAEIIRDKLTEDTKQLDVVSIIGMGGLGKTTLATKVFNDRFLVYHFHVRAWVTVSQAYTKQDLLIQILTSIGVQLDLEKDDVSKLHEKLHKKLMRRRYLIVIDDIWSIDAWDELKLLFPHDNTASRILLTSRLYEVALHAKPHGFVYSLAYLTEKQSWELLKQKVFHGDECPEWLIEPGMQIAKKCQGLPLSVVVMAGILAKEEMSIDLWEKFACSIGSYIVNDHKGNLETLALSYHHLPHHLRECFLYLGGFPEDFRFVVERLIWLWVAEGFIEEAENRSLEDTAKAYLKDLINRNLVIVTSKDLIGDVKACKLHDLLREVCLKKAREERFFLKIDSPPLSSQLHDVITYKQRRVFTNEDINIVTCFPTRNIRSVLCFRTHMYHSMKSIPGSFVLLRVLDLQKCLLRDVPQWFPLLVHLRYLAIWFQSIFPHSICKLWSLQTLILRSSRFFSMHLPNNIHDLVNLRHVWCNRTIYLPYIGKTMNLQSISKVLFANRADYVLKYIPNIKKLAIKCQKDDEYHFESLPYLETLKVMGPGLRQNRISFPATLKTLTLVSCKLPWRDMSIIQLLPNLEVLKLKDDAFMGRQWDASEQQFRQLKLLTLESLDIKRWEASSTSFPCLKRLSLFKCNNLKEIPLEIGEIATLELIEVDSSSNYVVESVKRIQQEQHDEGNYELKITVDGMELSFYLSQHEGSESE